jgi:arsenate reductase
MAEGFLRAMAPESFEVRSAGSKATALNPRAVGAMAEAGIDISDQTSKAVSKFEGERFDYVITVCEDDDKSCPVFTGDANRRLHWPFPDPAAVEGDDETVVATFRDVRDQIREKLEQFLKSERQHELT